jgi:release factor glutamine methyltransferase
MQPTISQLRARLAPHYPPGEVTAIVRLLLEEVCGLTRTQQLAHPDLVLPADQRERLDAIGLRLATGEPVQYVLGYEWFAGRRFAVSPATLIPRPETAELVALILSDLRAANCTSPTLLDVGTGTGCIALSLAAELPEARVFALDISEGALAVAAQNARDLRTDNVQLLRGDILHPEDLPALPPLDLIVSNPPYIRPGEAADMEGNVLNFEPHTALFVPEADPLLFYRAIAQFGRTHLRPGGHLYFEINAALGPETCALLTQLGYADVQLKEDAFGRNRMIRCRLAD